MTFRVVQGTSVDMEPVRVQPKSVLTATGWPGPPLWPRVAPQLPGYCPREEAPLARHSIVASLDPEGVSSCGPCNCSPWVPPH